MYLFILPVLAHFEGVGIVLLEAGLAPPSGRTSWKGPDWQIPLPKWPKPLQVFPKAGYFCPKMRSQSQNPLWLSPGTTHYTSGLREMLCVAGPGRESGVKLCLQQIRRFPLPMGCDFSIPDWVMTASVTPSRASLAPVTQFPLHHCMH